MKAKTKTPLTFEQYLAEIKELDGIEGSTMVNEIILCAERFGYSTQFHRTAFDRKCACILSWNEKSVFDLHKNAKKSGKPESPIRFAAINSTKHKGYLADEIVGHIWSKAVERDTRTIETRVIPVDCKEAMHDVLSVLDAFAKRLSSIGSF